jgi:sec-independent protein translocase protein TatA
MLHTIALGWPGPFEMIMLAGFGLLIFGKRLPEVGRSVGRTIIEFKKGMKEVENEMNDASSASSPSSQPALQPPHKFDPYTGKPLDQSTAPPPQA